MSLATADSLMAIFGYRRVEREETLKGAGFEDVPYEQRQQNLEQNVDGFLGERQSDAR